MTGTEGKACSRCGALVGDESKHRAWHKKLEGTSEPDPGAPGKGRAIVLDD